MKHLILASTILLSACAKTEVPVAILPPIELTTCDDMPTAPDLPAYEWQEKIDEAARQGTPLAAAMKAIDLAKEITRTRDLLMLKDKLDSRTAFGSCRSDVDGIRAWREAVE